VRILRPFVSFFKKKKGKKKKGGGEKKDLRMFCGMAISVGSRVGEKTKKKKKERRQSARIQSFRVLNFANIPA